MGIGRENRNRSFYGKREQIKANRRRAEVLTAEIAFVVVVLLRRIIYKYIFVILVFRSCLESKKEKNDNFFFF